MGQHTVSLEVSIKPLQESYSLGEDIEIEYSYSNVGEERVVLLDPPKILIQPQSREMKGLTRPWPVGERKIVVEPGETVSNILTWDQKNDDGQQVEPGWYNIGIEPHRISGASGMRYGSSEVLIQYPQGAMEGVIVVNQSRGTTGLINTWTRPETVFDLTLTLERVELSSTNTFIYGWLNSPQFATVTFDHAPWMGASSAKYTIDSSAKHALGFKTGERTADKGLGFRWELNPIPVEAEELTFTVTSIFDWQVTWEFQIPLH